MKLQVVGREVWVKMDACIGGHAVTIKNNQLLASLSDETHLPSDQQEVRAIRMSKTPFRWEAVALDPCCHGSHFSQEVSCCVG